MKLLKLVAISAVAFFLLMLVFSLLIPSHVRISRAVDIDGRKEALAPFLQTRDGWSKWNSLANPEAGGRLNLVSVTDTLVTADYISPKQEMVKMGLATYKIKSGTLTVQWYIDFHTSWYPWEKFGSILYDNQFGPVMEKDLQRLKQLIVSP